METIRCVAGEAVAKHYSAKDHIVFGYLYAINQGQFYIDLIARNDFKKMKDNALGYLWTVFTNRCPRCREGKIFQTNNAYNFKNNMKMNEHCPVCGQVTEIEVGFYYGTSYVSYVLTVLYSVITFAAWWLILGFSLYDNSIWYWIIFNGITLVALQPPFMRLSRTLWLSWFVKYDCDWQNHGQANYERIVKEHMNNW